MRKSRKRPVRRPVSAMRAHWKLIVLVIIAAFTAVIIPRAYVIYSNRIGVIEIKGEIIEFEGYAELIRAAMDDQAVKAAVIRVDSPGGTVPACFEIHTYIEMLSAKKPTVASFGGLAPSGAYYIACPANPIFAHSYTVTGGLGVIVVWVDMSRYYEKEGIRIWTWSTGEHKDLGAPWREPTAEENRMIEEKINRYLRKMLDDIYEHREKAGLTREALENARDGSIWDGLEAKRRRFVDEIGDYSDAIEKARQLAGLQPGQYLLVKLNDRPDWLSLLKDSIIRALTP